MASKWEYIRVCTPDLSNLDLATNVHKHILESRTDIFANFDVTSPVHELRRTVPNLQIYYNGSPIMALFLPFITPLPKNNVDRWTDISVLRYGLTGKHFNTSTGRLAAALLTGAVYRSGGYFYDFTAPDMTYEESRDDKEFGIWRRYIGATLSELEGYQSFTALRDTVYSETNP
jgi:hypothetical protein